MAVDLDRWRRLVDTVCKLSDRHLRRYIALRESVEALADDCQHSRQMTDMDPTILCRDGKFIDIEAALRNMLIEVASDR